MGEDGGMVTETKRGCVRCGGDAYHPYLPECEHAEWWELVPEPHLRRDWGGQFGGERYWLAFNPLGNEEIPHPTREGAIALYRERYAIGMFVDALFRKLTGWAKEGEQLRKLDEVIGHVVLGGDTNADGTMRYELDVNDTERTVLVSNPAPEGSRFAEELSDYCRRSSSLWDQVTFDVPTIRRVARMRMAIEGVPGEVEINDGGYKHVSGEPRPLRVGDRVRDEHGTEGTLEYVGNRSATVRLTNDLAASGVPLASLTRIDDEEPREADSFSTVIGVVMRDTPQGLEAPVANQVLDGQRVTAGQDLKRGDIVAVERRGWRLYEVNRLPPEWWDDNESDVRAVHEWWHRSASK